MTNYKLPNTVSFQDREERVVRKFFLGKPQSLLLRPSSDWMKLTWVMEGPLLYSWSTDLTVNHIEKRPSHQHLDWCLTKQLGTMA